MSSTTRAREGVQSSATRSVPYSVLIGLSSLGVLLQGLWAGIFLSYDERPDKWVNVHARGAEVTIIVTALALVVAVWKQRSRRDLLIGTAVLLVLLFVEAYLGGRITDDGDDKLTAVHVPLAMVITGLAVWLPLRARAGRRAAAERL